MLERLGIADVAAFLQRRLSRFGTNVIVAAKTILSSRPDREDEMPANRVARGNAEIALHQIQELRAVPGVAVVGPFPGDLDGTFLFSAVLVNGTARQKAGEQLIAFLIAPHTEAVMMNRGMEPFSAPR